MRAKPFQGLAVYSQYKFPQLEEISELFYKITSSKYLPHIGGISMLRFFKGFGFKKDHSLSLPDPVVGPDSIRTRWFGVPGSSLRLR